MQVQIRRREEISHLPTKVINESKIFVGSHFDGRSPLKGLSDEDEKKYLPRLIGVSANHQDFAAKAREFWASMGFLVPSSGVVLDITKDGDEPYNIEDWIRYQWVKRHKLVALNKKEMESDPRKRFYIYDPEEDTRLKNASIQIRKSADVEFIKATKDVDKAKRIVRLMDNIMNPDSMSETQIENRLFDLKNEDPEKFLRIATDKKLDTKAELQELVNAEILRTIGNQYIYIDQVIGETIDDAVIWYQNSKNSSVVTSLKAKLQEIKRNG